MLCSPTPEIHKEETLPPTESGLPDELQTPWQRIVSLLRTTMNVPMALVMCHQTPGMQLLVMSQEESIPLALPGYFSDKMKSSGDRFLVEDARNDPGWAEHPPADSDVIACLGEPIRHSDGSLFGTLCVVDQKPNTFPGHSLLTEFRHTMEAHLDLMATRRALTLEAEKSAALSHKLAREATTDPLTGLLNRHNFEERFFQEIARHKRAEHPLSIIICDLDRFKELNDTKGRSAGDELLVTLATLFKDRLRAHDLIWRWGGDEFLLLLPDTPLMGAVEVVESVRHLVEEKAQLETTRVTLSAGVTNFNPNESQDDCLARCNRLLEAAKEKGRNCVILG
ncbi:hypothetical protein DSLASN_38890 [Desulfoluna limicola]|uniref:diguanylate cyclase n=1 Tax=Desulfoluna limicola TaxID=2810562 RepID=A0ABM7PL23_9BACT|nr:sensor domain-containing diguanylate cyclase [Desulfoluna limicola]BCS98257.1 hypothetical protein DSLASN_38890 [Desulfoluna limicola]